MTCSSCGRFHDGGEWPDGEKWCKATLKKKPHHVKYALCPSCCPCRGKKQCSSLQVVVTSLFE